MLIGRATRLAQFLSSATKTYTAQVQFGWSTDTYDSAGEPTGPPTPATVDRRTLESALGQFRGTFAQQPPAYSAKKVGGHRAYALARASRAVTLDPVMVTVHDLRLVDLEGAKATVEIDELGRVLCAVARTRPRRRSRRGGPPDRRCGAPGAASSTSRKPVPFGRVLDAPDGGSRPMVPAGALLGHLEGCRLSDEGVRWVHHGRDIEPRLLLDPPRGDAGGVVRLLDSGGTLVALGVVQAVSGVLHPIVVLR